MRVSISQVKLLCCPKDRNANKMGFSLGSVEEMLPYTVTVKASRERISIVHYFNLLLVGINRDPETQIHHSR